MKEMVGGCCVCSDERGWTENPLVYCDGQGCNVAVHQACYGIIQVPKGPWYCRKCESQERAARVRCELCPMKDGALKRTDSNSWCHVVCALFIPEAWFANVQTMEPIVLKNVPQERFNKVICYICEEQGRETKASTGACMQCNKNGCKQYFHVTCAQSQGLLCEEAGNYGDNVKYCGYCAYHCKKLKRDANIKTIPAFKPIPSDTTTPDTSPEKNTQKLDPDKKIKEVKIKVSEINFQSPTSDSKKLSQTPPSSTSATDSTILSPTEFTGFTSADLKESTNKSDGKVDASVTKPKSVNNCDDKLESNSTLSTSLTSIQTNNQVPFSASFDKTPPVVFPSHNSPDTDQGAGKRSRSRSQEKSDTKKKIKRTKPAAVGGKSRPSRDSLPTPPSGGGKKQTPSTSGTSNGGSKMKNCLSPGLTSPSFTSSVFGGSPFFQSLSASGPISLSAFNQSAIDGSFSALSLGPPTLSLPSYGRDEHNESNSHYGPPKIFPSQLDSMRAEENSTSEFPASMEQLLERQWEQGSQFLLEQGQHFDIASLLNCLYQLQNENQQLGEYIKNLTSRRDHLLAVNARLSLPFSNSSSEVDSINKLGMPNGDIMQDGSSESQAMSHSSHQDTPSPSDSASPKSSVESRLSASTQDSSNQLFPVNLTSSTSQASVSIATSLQSSTNTAVSSNNGNVNGVQNYKNKDKT
ncbi:protein AF-10 isoform X2 [Patella vulgata]|uniref:protein AF-10 isoform X2 n=1 Tax=Patella vulgata TaxID=6465 RepID=UPI00217FA7BF|nr:protein AF-10 isoform X2 [Patella vulgata]